MSQKKTIRCALQFCPSEAESELTVVVSRAGEVNPLPMGCPLFYCYLTTAQQSEEPTSLCTARTHHPQTAVKSLTLSTISTARCHTAPKSPSTHHPDPGGLRTTLFRAPENVGREDEPPYKTQCNIKRRFNVSSFRSVGARRSSFLLVLVVVHMHAHWHGCVISMTSI